MCHPPLLSGGAICNIVPQSYLSIPFSFYSYSYILMSLRFPSSVSCITRCVCDFFSCITTPAIPTDSQCFLNIFFLFAMILPSCIPHCQPQGHLRSLHFIARCYTFHSPCYLTKPSATRSWSPRP